MSASSNQSEGTIEKLSEKLLHFLRTHPEESFEIGELAQSVGGRQMELEAALEGLRRDNAAKCILIDNKSYYCFSKDEQREG